MAHLRNSSRWQRGLLGQQLLRTGDSAAAIASTRPDRPRKHGDVVDFGYGYGTFTLAVAAVEQGTLSMDAGSRGRFRPKTGGRLG